MDLTVVVDSSVDMMVIVRKTLCVTVSMAVSVSVSVTSLIDVAKLVMGTVWVVRTTEITVTVVGGRVTPTPAMVVETVLVTGLPTTVVGTVTVEACNVTVADTVRTVDTVETCGTPGWLTTEVVKMVLVTVIVTRGVDPLLGADGDTELDEPDPDPAQLPNGL